MRSHSMSVIDVGINFEDLRCELNDHVLDHHGVLDLIADWSVLLTAEDLVGIRKTLGEVLLTKLRELA